MFPKTLLYVLFSFSLLFSSCSTTSKNYSSKKYHSKSKVKTHRKSTKTESYSNRSGSAKKRTTSRASSELSTRNSITNYAVNFKGTPYIYGGKSPQGFDCSGLITHVYKNKGIALSGNSTTLSKMGRKVSLNRAKIGDLIFFGSNGRVSHVAIISQNKNGVLEVIHATSSRGVVKENIAGSKYWTPKILFVRDVLSNTELAD